MTFVRQSALRQAFAAILLVVLTLSGVGRSMALADVGSHRSVEISGVVVEICHSDAGGPSVPDAPGRHDCCDACVLGAAVALPEADLFVEPARVEHFAKHGAALTWAPAIAAVPTPRLSQGPPAA